MLVVFSFFCLQFILNLIGNILFAHQEPALTNLITPLGNVVSLIIIFILIHDHAVRRPFYGVRRLQRRPRHRLACLQPAVPRLEVSPHRARFPLYRIPTLQRPFRPRRPILHHPDRLHGDVLQRQYHADPLVRSRLPSPSIPSPINISPSPCLINGIITATYWSAFTDAYVRQEFDWVRNTIRRMEKVTYLLMAGVILQTILAGPLIHLWVHKVHVPLDMQMTICALHPDQPDRRPAAYLPQRHRARSGSSSIPPYIRSS